MLAKVGRAAIDKTGISKFGIREKTYDVLDVEPTWGNGDSARYEGWMADKGAGYKPKLVVTYTTGWTNIAKVNGVAATDLAKVDGIAVASIAKISGVAV